MKRAPRIVLIAFMSVFFSGQALAGKTLSGDEIKALVTGKTIESEHLIRDFTFKVYFDKDGETAYRTLPNGNIKETTYSIKGNRHCIFWQGKDRCAQIQENGDGTYYRVNFRGKKTIKWNNVSDGKNL